MLAAAGLLLAAVAAALVAANWALVRAFVRAVDHLLPAALKIIRHGLLSVDHPRLLPTPRTRRVTLRLPAELGGGVLFSASSVAATAPLTSLVRHPGRPLHFVVEGAALTVSLQPGTLEPTILAFLAWLGLVRMPSCADDQLAAGKATFDASADAPPPDGEEPPPPPPLGAEGEALAAAVAAAADAAGEGGALSLPRGLSLEPVRGELTARLRVWGAKVTIAGGALTLPSALTDVIGTRVSLFVTGGASTLRRPGEGRKLSLPSLGWARPASAPPPSPAGGVPLLPVALRAEAEKGAVSAYGWLTSTGFTLSSPARAALDLTPALVRGVLGRIHPLLAGAVRLLEDDSVRVSLEPVHPSAPGHLPCTALDVGVDPLRLALRPTPLVLGALRMVGGARAKAGSPAPPGVSPPSKGPTATSGRREDVALCGMSASGSKPAAAALPPDALQAWTGPIAARVHFANFWVESGRLDMLASRNFAGGAGAAHLAMWGVVSLAAPQAADAASRAARARARWKVAAGWGRRGAAGSPPPRPPPCAAPAPGRLDMTMAILSDSLGLSDATAGGVGGREVGGQPAPAASPPPPPPTPAARVSVRGSADSPDIAWLAATRDVLSALAEAHAAPAGSRLSGWLARRRADRECAAGPPPPPAGALPWESRLQRAGASRRAAEAGAPLPATSAARLGRAQAGRLGGGGKVGGSKGGGGVLRAPKGSSPPAKKQVAWSRDAYVAPPLKAEG